MDPTIITVPSPMGPSSGAVVGREVGTQVTLERRPDQVMADSCAGDPNCTATKTVDLVIAVKPSSTSATTAAVSAALVGQTDTNPAHWAPSNYEQPQRIQQRIHGDAQPTLVNDFPVTMNGCNTRQLRVKWRSVDSPVAAGIADYADATTPPPEVTKSASAWRRGASSRTQTDAIRQSSVRLMVTPLLLACR